MKKETFIPLNMNLRKGQRAYYNKPSDKVKMTPLVRLLAMAYIYEQRLKENSDMSQKEFCELNNISPRYLRGILQFNFLSPAIKRKIANMLINRVEIHTNGIKLDMNLEGFDDLLLQLSA